MSEDYTQIDKPGIAPPKYAPKHIKDSVFHKEMMAIASIKSCGEYNSVIDRFIQKKSLIFDKCHMLKYRNFVFQRYFPLKLMNFIIYLLERNRVSKVHYLPFFLSLDICNVCNLRCPGCPTGLRAPSIRKAGMATIAMVKRVIDEAARKCVQIEFCHIGEPLLNEEFYSACYYAAQKGLWTTIHSNLNIEDKDLARKIVDSGLHNLIISCDGATQEIYEKYRRGGNIELMFENIKRISIEKNKRKLTFPQISAKFLIFDHNWHEIKLFKEKALAAGADCVLFSPAYMKETSKSNIMATAQVFNLEELKWEDIRFRSCKEIWDRLLLDYDGAVYPCCGCFKESDLFINPEDARKMKLIEQWNSPQFISIRSFFLGKSNMELHDLPQPCNTCRMCTYQLRNNM